MKTYNLTIDMSEFLSIISTIFVKKWRYYHYVKTAQHLRLSRNEKLILHEWFKKQSKNLIREIKIKNHRDPKIC